MKSVTCVLENMHKISPEKKSVIHIQFVGLFINHWELQYMTLQRIGFKYSSVPITSGLFKLDENYAQELLVKNSFKL